MKHKNKLPVIFISGPYRSDTEYGLVQNIREAEACAIDVWERGGAAICPHMNTAHFGGVFDDEVCLDGYLEILSRCDAVYTTTDWRKSKGALGEVEFAILGGIQVLYTPDHVRAFVEQWKVQHETISA